MQTGNLTSNELNSFHPDNHPQVEEELVMVVKNTAHTNPVFKADMIVSFLRDHALQTDWIKRAPELARLLSSRSLNAPHTENLFEQYRSNRTSLTHVEDYVFQKLHASIPKKGNVPEVATIL